MVDRQQHGSQPEDWWSARGSRSGGRQRTGSSSGCSTTGVIARPACVLEASNVGGRPRRQSLPAVAARRPAFPPRPLPRVCRRSACFWFDAKGVAGDYAGDAAASASSPPVEGPWRGPWACRRAARALLRGITRGRGRAPTHAVVRRQACDDVLWWHRLWAWGYYDRDGLGLPCWSTRSAAVAAALCLEIITFLCSKQ